MGFIYFVKGYGYDMSRQKMPFNTIIEVKTKTKENILTAIEECSGLSEYRYDKTIIIEEMVAL